MSREAADQQPGVTAGVSVTHERIALVAGEGPSETVSEILAILAREGFGLTFFDRLALILEAEQPPSFAAIILWLEDAISSVSAQLGPLTKRFGRTPVVVACSSIERWEVRAALSAGAVGVIVEEDLQSGLTSCLRAVRAGQICVPREHWRQVEPPALSAREKQVLGLVVGGYMNSQIAERLFLAESTVKSHLSSAFSKLGVRSRNEAADLILDPERGLAMGILSPEGEPLEMGPAAAR
jgi:DNA-binding NarL/FixJ family response regulator